MAFLRDSLENLSLLLVITTMGGLFACSQGGGPFLRLLVGTVWFEDHKSNDILKANQINAKKLNCKHNQKDKLPHPNKSFLTCFFNLTQRTKVE